VIAVGLDRPDRRLQDRRRASVVEKPAVFSGISTNLHARPAVAHRQVCITPETAGA
jgi:hypothetical protein